MNWQSTCGAFVALLGLIGIGLGQDPVPAPVPDGAGTKANEAESSPPPRQRARNETFLNRSPQIGELIPDVAAYDADGNRVRLRELTKGHYSVLVFGCLT